MTWYFTFGSNHYPGLSYYTKLRGTQESTRKQMFEIFGEYWAMQYDFKKGYDIVHGNNPWPKPSYTSAYSILRDRQVLTAEIQDQFTWFRMLYTIYRPQLTIRKETRNDETVSHMILEKDNMTIQLYDHNNPSKRIFLQIQNKETNQAFGCCTTLRTTSDLRNLVELILLGTIDKIVPMEYYRIYRTDYQSQNFNGTYISKYYSKKVVSPYNILDYIQKIPDNLWQSYPSFV
jgi:hypothetical protein